MESYKRHNNNNNKININKGVQTKKNIICIKFILPVKM